MKNVLIALLMMSGTAIAQDDMKTISEEDGSIGTFKYESEEDLREATLQEEEVQEDEDQINVGDGWRRLDDGEDTVLETEHD